VTWAASSGIGYGKALSATKLNATASVAGTRVYTPAAGTVLNAGASQSLSVTFTPTDSANYTTATASVSISVAKATPTITWAAPGGITYGTALSAKQLNATASVAGTFAYSPAAGTVLSAGAGQSLSVTFTPTAPSGITYGTALSATQLNATANAAGTFASSPAAGTVLTLRAAHPISVTFTPTDSANYTTATASVSISVAKATPTITWAAP